MSPDEIARIEFIRRLLSMSQAENGLAGELLGHVDALTADLAALRAALAVHREAMQADADARKAFAECLSGPRNDGSWKAGEAMDRASERIDAILAADPDTQGAALVEALGAMQKNVRRAVSFMEDAPELWGNPAANAAIDRLNKALGRARAADDGAGRTG